MMKRNLTTTLVVLTVALSMLGVSYAHWQDMLIISGSVSAGDLCVKVEYNPSSHTILDARRTDWTILPGFVGDGWNTGKDIAETWVYIDTQICCPKTVYVTVENAYPCYYTDVTFDVENCGSTPAKLVNVTFNPGGYVITDLSVNDVVELDITGDGEADIEFKWKEPFLNQLDPEYEHEISFEIHVLNAIPENMEDLHFSIEMAYWNWNEPWPMVD